MKKILSLVAIILTMVCFVVVVSLNVSAAGTDFSTAREIAVNTEYTDNIADEKEIDFFKFILPSAGSVYINFKHENLFDKNEFWYCKIYDEEARYVSSYRFYGTDTNIDTYSVGLEEGVYYLSIHGGNWSDYYNKSNNYSRSDYKFQIKYMVSEHWEYENSNEDFQNAQNMKVNSIYGGSICQEDDEDYYKIELTSAGSINLFFSHENLFDQSEYWTATIFDSETNYVSSYSFYGTDEFVKTYSIGLDKGTYYIRIRGGDWSDYYDKSNRFSEITYSFSIDYAISPYWEKENNNENFNVAQNININVLYSGSICQNNDEDYYKLILNGKKDLKLSFNIVPQNNSNEYYTVKIYDYETNELRSYSVYGNKKTTDFYLTLYSGTYYVDVRGGDWSDYYGRSNRFTKSTYSIKISEEIPTVKGLAHNYSANTITLKWKADSNITGYEIFTYDTKKKTYVKAGTTTKTSYKLKNLKSGTTYKFKVRAYIVVNDVKYYSDLSPEYTAATKPAQVTLKSVKSAKTKTATVSWNKVSGASGYTVVYSTSKKFKKSKTVTVKKGSTVKAIIKKLSKGKKYYFKVRAYKTVNGKKIYGAYSSVKSVKVK